MISYVLIKNYLTSIRLEAILIVLFLFSERRVSGEGSTRDCP